MYERTIDDNSEDYFPLVHKFSLGILPVKVQTVTLKSSEGIVTDTDDCISDEMNDHFQNLSTSENSEFPVMPD